MDNRNSLIKPPTNDIPDEYSQMDVPYSNIKCPSDYLTDGYSIFKCQTSIWPAPRWIFDFGIFNIHLTITCLIDDNKRDDLTLGDNSIDDFKIGDTLDFTMFMSCICNLFVKF